MCYVRELRGLLYTKQFGCAHNGNRGDSFKDAKLYARCMCTHIAGFLCVSVVIFLKQTC